MLVAVLAAGYYTRNRKRKTMDTLFFDDLKSLTGTLKIIDNENGSSLHLLDDAAKERIINRYTTSVLPNWLNEHGFNSTVYVANVNLMDWWLVVNGFNEVKLTMKAVQELAYEGDKSILARMPAMGIK